MLRVSGTARAGPSRSGADPEDAHAAPVTRRARRRTLACVGTKDCISLLTDYGLEDGFVAACHGVAARIAPAVRVIDITHLVPAGDVRRGGSVLAQTVPYLPPGVHVAVVDPGVGTARRAVAVSAGDRIFVGPDNGLLSWPLSAVGGAERAYALTNEKLWLHPVSATFHGRDIFMPVAAHLAAGLALDSVGDELDVEALVRLPEPSSRVADGRIDAEVVSVDRFGNIQLSARDADLAQVAARVGGALVIEAGRRQFAVPLRDTFGSVPPGDLVAYTDSAGQLAVAVNSGDAAERLGLPPGAQVRLTPSA